MKYIEKHPQPHELIAWARAKATDLDGEKRQWNYDDMPADVRKAVKENLVREQGGLCCYTGRRITPDTSHIEHKKPQALCVDHEDTDYANLLAAHPAADDPRRCPYGAHEKGSWYNEHQFVHPLRRDCEQRFRYRDNGNVVAASTADRCAAETIKRLRLDHTELKLMRKGVIDELYAQKLGRAQARRLMEEMDQRDGNGNFRPFCFVIKQACAKYLKRFE
jgi:uncharacterized protein (TIGR02646 family)